MTAREPFAAPLVRVPYQRTAGAPNSDAIGAAAGHLVRQPYQRTDEAAVSVATGPAGGRLVRMAKQAPPASKP